MSVPLSVADVLDRAADLIEPEGRWHQGSLAGDKEGRHLRAATTGADFCAHCWCAFGAIQKAGWLVAREEEKRRGYKGILSFHRREIEAATFVADGLGLSKPDYLFRWNDAPSRKQTEVVAALRRAADLARARPAEFGNIGADGVQS